EPAPGDQAGDPGQDTGLVLDQNAQGVGVHSSSPSQFGAMSRATLMSSLLVPAATIGHTIASLCTTNSTTTGASLIAIALSITASTSPGCSARRPTQHIASASFWKSGTRLVFRSVLE